MAKPQLNSGIITREQNLESRSWGVGELGNWGIGELGNWGIGELGNWGREYLTTKNAKVTKKERKILTTENTEIT